MSRSHPTARKPEEIELADIIDDIYSGRFRSVVKLNEKALNIIGYPSSRVENEAFIDLAQSVKEMTEYAKDHAITIAVMGCRVNGRVKQMMQIWDYGVGLQR